MIIWSSFDGIRHSVHDLNSRTNSSLVEKNCNDRDPMREGPFVFFNSIAKPLFYCILFHIRSLENLPPFSSSI